MNEQKNGAANKLKEFLSAKNTKTNVAMQRAQKMINLYRSLEDFGEDFIDKYNAELLQIPEDVELMLNALVSGAEVRQYLEYLRHSGNSETKNESGADVPQNGTRTRGYLPGPEADSFGTVSNSGDVDMSGYVSKSDFEKFKADQANLIRELSEKMIANQTQALLQAMGHFAQNMGQNGGQNAGENGQPSGKSGFEDYSEIIEDKQAGSDAMAGFKNKGNK